MFDGNILNWTTFWEQFDISMHSRFDLATAEKLAYLRVIKTHPGKDGIVRVVTIRASSGREYTRPVVKIVPLLYVKDN